MSTVQPDLEALAGQHVAAIIDALPPARLAQEMAELLMVSIPRARACERRGFPRGIAPEL
jgi:hypothetical protein